MKLNDIFKIIFIFYFLSTFVQAEVDPDEKRTYCQLIESRGFLLLEYHVTTQDGYNLTVDRVVPKDWNPVNYSQGRKPLIAFHGIMSSSPVFFTNSPFLSK